MEFRMRCKYGHEWFDNFPMDHPLFAQCPYIRHVNDSRQEIQCRAEGKVIERVDSEGDNNVCNQT